MVMMVKGCKECLLAQPVNVRCGHPMIGLQSYDH